MTTTPATTADATTNPNLSPRSLRVRAMFFATSRNAATGVAFDFFQSRQSRQVPPTDE